MQYATYATETEEYHGVTAAFELQGETICSAGAVCMTRA